MATWLIILLSIIGLFVVIASIQLITFHDHITYKLQKIEKLKSEVRLYKAKYIQTIKMSSIKGKATSSNQKDLIHEMKSNGAYSSVFGNGIKKGYAVDINELHEFDNSNIQSLSNALLNVQNELNKCINDYNFYISKALMKPYSYLFKYKKLEYIDQSNFDKSLVLEDIDGYGL